MPYKGRRSGGKRSAGGKAIVAKYGRAHMREIGQNGYYKVMARYGVERPPPPRSLNERRWMAEQERAQQPDAQQGALFMIDDTRKAA
jgi:hypothetical protein